MTRRELLRHPGLLGLVARDVISLAGSQRLQSAGVVWFTTAGLRERARSKQLVTEPA